LVASKRSCDERREVLVGERGEGDRASLAVEGPLAVGEQAAHHPRVRSREEIAHLGSVLLDDAAQRSVEGRLRAEHRLELVEGHDHLGLGSLGRLAEAGRAG